MNKSGSPDLAPATFPDELDLARYLAVLRRRWLLVVICGVLGALAAFAYTTLAPKSFTAEAYVAIIRTGSIVNFDPRYVTVSDTDPNSQTLVSGASLAPIASSQEFAASVISRVGAQLPERLREPQNLLDLVKLSNQGTLTRVQVTTETPELASLLANTWAALYVERVNDIFNEPAIEPDTVQSQAEAAKREYDAREAELVAFLETSPVEPLKSQINTIQKQIDSQVVVENKLTQLLADAQALRGRIYNGGETVAPGDELAHLIIESNAFNNGGDTSLFRMDWPSTAQTALTSRDDLLARLDSLIAAIQARRDALGGEKLKSLAAQLTSAQSQLEQATAQQKELTAARDLAWTTYQTVANKVAETGIKSSTLNQVLRIATTAETPTEPVQSRRTLNTLIGGLVGLIIGIILALVVDALPSRVAILQRAS